MRAVGVDFASVTFGPVIRYPVGAKLHVLDLSGEKAAPQFASTVFTIGRYLEKRGIYTSALFGEGAKRRCIHLGVDLGAPVGTPVHAPLDGKVGAETCRCGVALYSILQVAFCGYNPAEGDYGHCLITQHVISGRDVWFLFGHLGRDVLQLSGQQGQPVVTGAVLGHLVHVHLFIFPV